MNNTLTYTISEMGKVPIEQTKFNSRQGKRMLVTFSQNQELGYQKRDMSSFAEYVHGMSGRTR